MNPKRKGFIWAACFFALVAFIFATMVLGVSLYNLESPIRRIPVPLIHTWQILLTEMIIWSVGVSIVCIYTVWVGVRARQRNKTAAVVIILCHCLAMGVGIYVTLSLEQVYQMPDVTSKELYDLTYDLIQKGKLEQRNIHFLPPWLEQIQKRSRKCCGIVTFHDWETFWAPLSETYPKSCCHRERLNCTTSVRDIVYPDLMGLNIKQNGGCYDEITTKVKHIVLEAKKFCAMLTVTIGVSLAAVCALFVVVFFLKKYPQEDQDGDDDSDEDDYQPMKFPPEELTWRNLEFYRVLIKRKKKYRAEGNFLSGTASIDPVIAQSSDFQQPFNQQQPSPVEYRVDVLSASTLSAQSPQQTFDPVPVVPLLPPPPPQFVSQVLNSSPTDAGVVGGTAPGAAVTVDVDDDQEPQNKLRVMKKGRHRHRRRPQENDVDIPLN